MNGNAEFWEGHYANHGNANQSPFTSAKNEKILQLIPNDVKTILDVGCGGGSLMVFLLKQNRFDIEGVDLSSSGVDHIVRNLKLKARVGNVLDLSVFEDNSFDMVICSEVLEHIEAPKWEQALKELGRVSKKYILTTNPYHESLKYHQVVCNGCKTRFHPVGHIHSVDHAFVETYMKPHVKNLSVHHCGKRNWYSILYSTFIRNTGHQMVDTLEVSCPCCMAEVPFKKWGIPLKILNRIYLGVQFCLGKLGLHRPATIICLSEPKDTPLLN